jgi:mono/diheme cytochrome c family protein
MKTIVVPPGYRVELVAKEPMVIDPIIAEFDADGRLWIVEMPGFAQDMAMSDSREPVCRVVVLEDLNDDGTMDKRTVFADGLVLPRAMKVVDGGILLGEPPTLWLMRDTDGDLKVDTKDVVADTYGRREANIEHNANSLIWGLDNWIYTSEHDWHLRFKGGKYEVVPTLSRGQWGGSIDDAGRIYRNVNSAPLFADFTLARYFVRNPNAPRTRGLYEPVISIEDATVWPIRPTKGVNRGYREQFFRPDGSSTILQSAGTPVVYRGDRLPADVHGNVFVSDSTTNLVHRFVVVDDGGHITVKNAYEKGEIFASTDERLRPVNLTSGPDGTLYIVDMYRGVVQDVSYQTEYLQDYIKNAKLEMPIGRGRIWRLTHDTTQRDRKPALSKETPAGLVQYLSHPNGWWRDMAQMLLVQRGDASVVPALRTLATTSPDWRAKLHAMGTLDGLDGLDVATVQSALADKSPEVRAWGIRWSERWLAEPGHPLAATVLGMMNDTNWIVRRQLAASIGELPAPARVAPAATMLERFGGDAMTVDATLSGLRGIEAEVFSRMLQVQTSEVESDGVAMLVGAIARSGNLTNVQAALAVVADAQRPEWLRTAVLRGLDAGLPAAGGRGGGRGGGGGGGRGGPAPAARITLPAEPVALTALAAGTSPLALLAKTVAGKLEWTGKPAPVFVVPPLTPEETKRYEAGAEVYKNLCVACHQPTGLGLEKVAPSLVGSPLAVAANADVPTRIVLGGKEGQVGLMPPLGMLTDEQVASVLTYVRREWGNTASPVTPESVQEVRGLTSTRKRPWTDAELMGGRGGNAGRAGGAGAPGAGRGQQ